MPTSRTAVAGGLVVSYVLLVAAVVGWGLLLTHPLAAAVEGPDDDVSRWFADQRTPTLSTVADVGTFLGETLFGVAVLAVAGIAFALWTRSWRPLVYVSVMYGGLGVLYVAVTHLVPRDRPPVRILDPGLVPDHSYPSGHVGTALAIAGCLLFLTRTYRPGAARWLIALEALPVFTLLSRLYQGAHHLTDVLTSLVLASVWLAVVTTRLLGPVTDRDRHP
jgi:undecaprenyl-diphosphatase